MVAKKKETKFSCILTPWSGSVAVRFKRKHCNNFYWVDFIPSTLFSGIVWINKIHNCAAEIFFNG